MSIEKYKAQAWEFDMSLCKIRKSTFKIQDHFISMEIICEWAGVRKH